MYIVWVHNMKELYKLTDCLYWPFWYILYSVNNPLGVIGGLHVMSIYLGPVPTTDGVPNPAGSGK